MLFRSVLAALAITTIVSGHPSDFDRPYQLSLEERDREHTKPCKYASKSHIYNVFSNAQKAGFYYNFGMLLVAVLVI